MLKNLQDIVRRKRIRDIHLGCVLAAIGVAAHAGDCGPLKLVTSVKMQMGSGSRPLVPVMINDTPRHFLFDTAGVVTQVSPALVDELKLPRHQSPLKTFDLSGNISQQMAMVETLAIGPLHGKKLQLQIGTANGAGYDGMLTPSLFPQVDVDLDFGSNRFAFFSQNHCNGRVVYWKAAAIAVVPMLVDDTHIGIPIRVEGHALQAIIDTGATRTTMQADVAARIFGLTPTSAGMTPAGNMNGDASLPLYEHTFADVSFEGVKIADAKILVMPDRVASKDRDNVAETGSRARHEDDDLERTPLIIGMDMLRKLHVYLALKERKLYITAAGAPDEPSPLEAAPK